MEILYTYPAKIQNTHTPWVILHAYQIEILVTRPMKILDTYHMNTLKHIPIEQHITHAALIQHMKISVTSPVKIYGKYSWVSYIHTQ